MKLKWLMLDLGGVIINHWKLIDGWIGKYKVNHWQMAEAMNHFIVEAEEGEISFTDFWQKVLDEVGLGDKLKEFMKLFLSGMELNQPLLKLVGEWKKKGLKMMMVSNNLRGYVKWAVTYYQLDKYFDLAMNSAEIGARKPDKEFYERALKETGVRAEECLFVDDLEENIEGAEKVGIKGFWFRNFEESVLKLKEVVENAGIARS
jgi:putative hydrolase of the HAD superfamily